MNMEAINIKTTTIRAELTTATQWSRESMRLLHLGCKCTGADRDIMLDKAREADRKASDAMVRLDHLVEEFNQERFRIRTAIANSREVK